MEITGAYLLGLVMGIIGMYVVSTRYWMGQVREVVEVANELVEVTKEVAKRAAAPEEEWLDGKVCGMCKEPLVMGDVRIDPRSGQDLVCHGCWELETSYEGPQTDKERHAIAAEAEAWAHAAEGAEEEKYEKMVEEREQVKAWENRLSW